MKLLLDFILSGVQGFQTYDLGIGEADIVKRLQSKFQKLYNHESICLHFLLSSLLPIYCLPGIGIQA
jgi:hypothetical protein